MKFIPRIVLSSLLLVLFIGTATAQDQPATQMAVLKGKIMDFPNKKFQMLDNSEGGALKRSVMNYQVGPDSSFRIQINMAYPTYVRIGQNDIFISPGDSLEARLYQANRGQKSEFSGTGATANNYLKSNLSVKGGSYLQVINPNEFAGELADPDKFEARVKALADARRKELEDLDGAGETFKTMEMARIDADEINSLLRFPGAVIARTQPGLSPPEKEALSTELLQKVLPTILVQTEKINQGRYLNVSNCREVLFLLNEKQDKTKAFQVQWDGYVRSNYLTQLMINSIGRGSVSQIASEKERLQGLGALAPYHIQILDEAFKPYKDLLKGAPAIDFKIVSPEGEVKNLSDFKGQVIVIDFWATWCRPCLREAPHFEKVKAQFPDMKFLSLSTDRDVQKWKTFLSKKEHGQDGNYHVAGKEIARYRVTSIPRFVVIGKDFTIVDAYAQRPSGTMAQFLKALE